MEELKPQFMSDEDVMRYMIQEREPSFFPRSTIQGTSAKNEWRKWERALYNYRKNLESKQMDEKRFTEKDLVSFGNYVLSEERNANIASEENRNVVGDWDIANWKEAEERITEELAPQVTGEFNISKIEVKNYSEIIDTEDESADRWFKCKIAMVTIDEVSGKEKKMGLLYLVKAESVDDAIKRTHKFLEGSVCDYEIALVTESPIVDIFGYEQREMAE